MQSKSENSAKPLGPSNEGSIEVRGDGCQSIAYELARHHAYRGTVLTLDNVGVGERPPPFALGRLPTDAILRPLTAFRSVTVCQAKKSTSPTE